MARIQQLLLIASVCLFGQIWAQLHYNSTDSVFDSQYNTTDPYSPSLSYQFGKRQAVFYQIVTNVTGGTFFNLDKIVVSYSSLIISMDSANVNFQGSALNSIGQVVDPCVFASPPSTAVLTFNGTTDAKEGKITSLIGAIDVPFVQNAVAFEYTNPVVINVGDAGKDSFVASRFYLMNLNVSENESWGLEATSTEDVSIAVAGLGNCPTWQFTNESIYWMGQISANQTVNTPVVAVKGTEFVSLRIAGQKSANVTLTWRQLPSSPVTPASEPSIAPGATNDNLPQWATALLIVFGIVIVVLVIVVIALCVKNRRRSTYQGV